MIICTGALTALLGCLTKLKPIDAVTLVKSSTLCVRAVPGKSESSAVVKEVVWGQALHKGDVFTTVDAPPGRPGEPTELPLKVVQDCIVFVNPAGSSQDAHRWKADVYRINISKGRVDCSWYEVDTGTSKANRVLLLDGRVLFSDRRAQKAQLQHVGRGGRERVGPTEVRPSFEVDAVTSCREKKTRRASGGTERHSTLQSRRHQ